MAQFDLYVDTYSGKVVGGPTNPAVATLPRFTQGDTISLRIYLLARTPSFPYGTPYSVINNAALSLKVALGPRNGTAGSALYTQQFTWARDATNSYFFADLPLNTAAITTLLGAAETATAYFEIEYTQNALPTTVLQEAVTIYAEVIETGVVTVPAGETALSAEVANATFLKNENNGFVIVNATTGHKVFCYLGDDDTIHFDPIT